MRLLVIGAEGFVGRHLAACAAREGHEVFRTTRAVPRPGFLPFELGRVRLIPVLPRRFFAGRRPAGAVICAAESRIDLCAREPAATRRVNVDATAEAVRDLAALGVRSVVLSTDYVFAGERGRYDETAVAAPVNEYGRQKRALEEAVLREVPGALVLRLSKLVGDDPAEAHLFSEWWAAARRGDSIRCIRGQVLSPTWVEDAVAGILLALERGLAGLYHLAAPESWGRAALARLFAEMLAVAPPIVEEAVEAFGFSDRRPLDTSLDGSRFARATGVHFSGMATVIGHFRDRIGTDAGSSSLTGGARRA